MTIIESLIAAGGAILAIIGFIWNSNRKAVRDAKRIDYTETTKKIDKGAAGRDRSDAAIRKRMSERGLS